MVPLLDIVMLLTGVSMMVKNYILGFSIGLFCSVGFSENEILWDFGVVIRQPEIQRNPKEFHFQKTLLNRLGQNKNP